MSSWLPSWSTTSRRAMADGGEDAEKTAHNFSSTHQPKSTLQSAAMAKRLQHELRALTEPAAPCSRLVRVAVDESNIFRWFFLLEGEVCLGATRASVNVSARRSSPAPCAPAALYIMRLTPSLYLPASCLSPARPASELLQEGTPYAGGHYLGTITFPANFPLHPPQLCVLTPSGRFTDGPICTSSTATHPETWKPTTTVAEVGPFSSPCSCPPSSTPTISPSQCQSNPFVYFSCVFTI